MFERIFLVVDGTPAARAAARVALRLAQATEGGLHACAALDPATVRHGTDLLSLRQPLAADLEREARAALGAVERQARRLQVPCAVTLERGGVAARLVARARRVRAQVIVIGTRGGGRLRAALVGSLAQAVVSQSPCPVLIVRHPLRSRRRRPGARSA